MLRRGPSPQEASVEDGRTKQKAGGGALDSTSSAVMPIEKVAAQDRRQFRYPCSKMAFLAQLSF